MSKHEKITRGLSRGDLGYHENDLLRSTLAIVGVLIPILTTIIHRKNRKPRSNFPSDVSKLPVITSFGSVTGNRRHK